VEAEWEKGRENRKEEAKRRDLDGKEDEGEWKARRRDALPCSYKIYNVQEQCGEMKSSC